MENNNNIIPKEDAEIYGIFANKVNLLAQFNNEMKKWQWVAVEFIENPFFDGKQIEVKAFAENYNDLIINNIKE